MIARSLSLAIALLAATSAAAFGQTRDDVIAAPVLRASVTVSGDLVRIGDVIDNAGPTAQIPIYRAPDLGTTGSLPVAQVLTALRAHQVIGVDTRNLRQIQVTRLARMLEGKDIELAVARALERRNGLGDAASLTLTFDRDVADIRLEASNTGAMQAVSTRFDSRSNRFDVTFEISNEDAAPPLKMRFTGTAIETVEAAVLTRGVERNETIKASDVVVERRPKAEIGPDVAPPRPRGRHAGAQATARGPGAEDRRSRQARSGAARPGRHADLPGRRTLSHHSRQGAGGRHRGRRDQRAQSAIQAHHLRRRHRPRPGLDHGRDAPPARDFRRHLLDRRRAGAGCGRRQFEFAHVSKSRVMSMFASRFHRFILTGALLATAALASGCSSIDRLSQIGEKPKLTEIENPTAQPGYKPVQMPMPKPETASYNANSLWRNGSSAFFKDQRAARIGDILTVTVNITDKANIANQTQRSRSNSEDSGITDFIGSKTLGAQGRRSCPAGS